MCDIDDEHLTRISFVLNWFDMTEFLNHFYYFLFQYANAIQKYQSQSVRDSKKENSTSVNFNILFLFYFTWFKVFK